MFVFVHVLYVYIYVDVYVFRACMCMFTQVCMCVYRIVFYTCRVEVLPCLVELLRGLWAKSPY